MKKNLRESATAGFNLGLTEAIGKALALYVKTMYISR